MHFSMFFAVRLISVFLVQTSFVPDEYWQSLEVAHRIAFGYGYLTWEWTKAIRSWTQPLLFASVYKILEYIHLDNAFIVIYIPRLLQALLIAYSEWKFCETLSREINRDFGEKTAFLNLVSWFLFYAGSRTIANTTETSLALLVLSYFLNDNLERCCLIVGLSSYLRPTAVALFVPVLLIILQKSFREKKLRILNKAIIKTLFLVVVLAFVDSYMYGRFVFVPFEFAKFNFLSNMSDFYGTQPWHWLLTNALPSVMGIALLPIFISSSMIKQSYSTELQFVFLCLCCTVSYISLHSLVAHKEIRFTMPVVPLLNTVAAFSLRRFRWKKTLIFLLLVTNVPAALYFGLRHQRGVLDVMHFLRNNVDKNDDILFLMPCHSTPLYSHLHRNVSTRFLTCEPNFNAADDYLDEAERFYQNPLNWLNETFDGPKPQWIFLFDKLQKEISPFLEAFGYRLKETFFHTDMDEGRIGKYILAFEK